MKKEYNNSIAYFNILRFIGAISISVLFHYNDHFLKNLYLTNQIESGSIWEFLAQYGFIFVEMFFIISGILFSFYYFKKINNGMNLKDFLINRVIRIYPVLIITTIFMYFANYVLYSTGCRLWSDGTLNIWELLSDMIFAGKSFFNAGNTLNGPIWYINVLMFCYILAFYLSKISIKKKSIIVFIIPILIGIMIKYASLDFLILNTRVARGLIAFFVGIVLGEALKKYDGISKENKTVIKTALAIVTIISIFVLTFKDRYMYVGDETFFYSFIFFPALITLLYDTKWLNKICSTKFVKYLGNISYGIYMWNFPILITFHILNVFNIVQMQVLTWEFIGILFVTHMVVATLSYFFLEKGWADLLKEIIEKKRKIKEIPEKTNIEIE